MCWANLCDTNCMQSSGRPCKTKGTACSSDVNMHTCREPQTRGLHKCAKASQRLNKHTEIAHRTLCNRTKAKHLSH